jgi:hypothetical protein
MLEDVSDLTKKKKEKLGPKVNMDREVISEVTSPMTTTIMIPPYSKCSTIL